MKTEKRRYRPGAVGARYFWGLLLFLVLFASCENVPLHPEPLEKADVVLHTILSQEERRPDLAETGQGGGGVPAEVLGESGNVAGRPPGRESQEGAPLTAGLPRLYNSEGRVDPFQPLIQKKSQVRQQEGASLQRRTPRTPLEKMDLTQLKLVGVVRSAMGPKAMIEEFSGRGYLVGVGTYIGLHSGKVTAIEGDVVVITEIVEDFSGEIQEKRRELKFQKPTGE